MQVRDVALVATGSPERLSLRLVPDARHDMPEAARVLVRRHLPIKTAHAALTELIDFGVTYVTVPCVEDVSLLKAELATTGVAARRHAPDRIDVRLVRERTSLSQSAFALRFGLDESTLRNWEQGRSEPGLAAMTLLWTIHRNPAAVVASIDMEEDEKANGSAIAV